MTPLVYTFSEQQHYMRSPPLIYLYTMLKHTVSTTSTNP